MINCRCMTFYNKWVRTLFDENHHNYLERSRLWCYEDVLDVLTENTVCIILKYFTNGICSDFFPFKCGQKLKFIKFGFCLNLLSLYFLLCSVIHLMLCLIRGQKKFEA